MQMQVCPYYLCLIPLWCRQSYPTVTMCRCWTPLWYRLPVHPSCHVLIFNTPVIQVISSPGYLAMCWCWTPLWYRLSVPPSCHVLMLDTPLIQVISSPILPCVDVGHPCDTDYQFTHLAMCWCWTPLWYRLPVHPSCHVLILDTPVIQVTSSPILPCVDIGHPFDTGYQFTHLAMCWYWTPLWYRLPVHPSCHVLILDTPVIQVSVSPSLPCVDVGHPCDTSIS